MIRHLVALRFRPDVDDAHKQRLYADLRALDQHIDGILDFQTRRNVSVETELVRGFQDLFWFDFRDEAARDAYLVHPAHQAVGAQIVEATQNGLEGVFVTDFKV